MEDKALLREIKELLQEQNRLIASLHAQVQAMAASNVEHMSKTGKRFWVVLVVLLLLLAMPSMLAK